MREEARRRSGPGRGAFPKFRLLTPRSPWPSLKFRFEVPSRRVLLVPYPEDVSKGTAWAGGSPGTLQFIHLTRKFNGEGGLQDYQVS